MSSLVDRAATNRDLVAVGGVVIVASAMALADVQHPVRFPPAFLLLLVLPGYVTMAWAYATRERGVQSVTAFVERFALSIGGSLAVLPLLAILAYLLFGEITTLGLVVVVSNYVLIGVVATGIRRARHAETPSRRSRSGGAHRADTTLGWLSGQTSVLTVVLVVSMVVAVASLGAAVTVPADGEGTTDLHLLTVQDERLVANDYPDTLQLGESAALTVGVTNDEHRTLEYTAVTEIQRVQVDGRSISVVEKRRIARESFRLAHGESWRESQEFEATLTGENLRFVTYLYRGDPPENPTTNSAYRTTYVWFEVQPSGSSGD